MQNHKWEFKFQVGNLLVFECCLRERNKDPHISQELEKKRSGRPDQAKQENQYQGKKHNHLLELKDKKPRLFELKEQNQT